MHSAYLLGNLFFFLIWLFFFFRRKDLRKEMLIVSAISAPMGPISEFVYRRDYWNPDLLIGRVWGIEDLLFGFLAGGVAAVIYEEFFGKHFSKRHIAGHSNFFMYFLLFSMAVLYVLTFVFKLNSIYSSSLIFIVSGSAFLFFRHDLLENAFISGVLMGIIMLIFYFFFVSAYPTVIESWWQLDNLSRIFLLKAPLEEVIWGFAWGFLAGPAYEFFLGLKLNRR